MDVIIAHQPASLYATLSRTLAERTPLTHQLRFKSDGTLRATTTRTYDRLNRLIGQSTVGSASGGNVVGHQYAYDVQGRMIRRREYTGSWSGSAWVWTEQVSEESRHMYDGWECVADLNSSRVIQWSYAWGLDLSGSRTGAGGVGGLLWVRKHTGSDTGRYFAAYDGNGNVTGLYNQSGSIVARYEYGPFGEALRVSGTHSVGGLNPWRWSTKRTEPTTDLVHYEYRVYDPGAGRWLSRDPIGERGGLNVYAFVENDPLSNIDALGLKSLNEIGGDVRSWIQSHFSGRGGISHTFPPLKFLVYAPPPVWLEANLTVSGEVFGCVHPETRKPIVAFKVGVSVDGFVAVGISLKKGVPGPRNERIPNPHDASTTVKRKNAPGEPGAGFRERNRYAEITLSSDCQICPNEGWTKIEGAAFFRGSAGLGWGYQFNVQKAINDSFTDITSGWSITGGRAWGTAGVSLEAGVTISSYLVGYMQ